MKEVPRVELCAGLWRVGPCGANPRHVLVQLLPWGAWRASGYAGAQIEIDTQGLDSALEAAAVAVRQRPMRRRKQDSTRKAS